MDHDHFMHQALAEADKAMARGEFPVGCILVHRNRILVSGARESSRADHRNELDHAEMVVLGRLNKLPDKYQSEDLRLYCTMEPCLMCFAALMLAGIGTIVYAYEDVMGGGTACDFNCLPALYRRRRPRVIAGILRPESLARFKAFFADPDNDYWRGSLLAGYTLSQELAPAKN
ncbi:MAG: nucleoside deaminase [Desulfosarcina sp.]|nr:nucleoside deaminase [Desulfobacterales bacterium]